MIKAIGVDIVDVGRIERAMRNPLFLKRILTPKERMQGDSPTYVAGRWAGKEAIAKAVGTHLTWQQVEILFDSKRGLVATVNGLSSNGRVHVSISHEKSMAVGLAVYEVVE
ncbi:MAG: holo-ACP synthase [Chthonomonadaceae bacterium]|nr:holo-ACP synthase [Chthonomonadaceae bacterium]